MESRNVERDLGYFHLSIFLIFSVTSFLSVERHSTTIFFRDSF